MSIPAGAVQPVVLDHSVVSNALRIMRMRETEATAFRVAARTVARALAYEATRRLPLTDVVIETPLEATKAGRLDACVVAVPILRAGLWMLDGFLDVIPTALTGFVGLKRNEETLLPYEYYRNVPPLGGSHLFLLDPMIATGGSIIAALNGLMLDNVQTVSVLSVIAAPEGLAAVSTAFPHAAIFTAALDRELNPVSYILPGLGDAGDRLCGTT